MNRYKLVITFLALSLTFGGGISIASSERPVSTVEELVEILKEDDRKRRTDREAQKREWEKERKRRAQALLELEPLAESGDSEAQFALGKIYHLIEGEHRAKARLPSGYYEKSQSELLVLANRNREQAETWLRRSAEKGNLEAQKYLWKDFYGTGSFTFFSFDSRSDKKNIHWAQIVAERGDPESQNYLGEHYQKGELLLQDYVKALYWLHLAATQGHARAMSNLGKLYSEVKGVKEDLVQAHKWFNLGGYAKRRDALAKKMTNEQIVEAQRLAREWKAKKKD